MSRGIDVVGADYGGLVSSLFNAGGAAVDIAKQSQKEKDDAAKADVKLQAAIAADQAATNAYAKATVSAALAKTDPSKAGAAKADQLASDTAQAAQDKAGADVPDDKKDARTAAAQTTLDSAKTAYQDALRAGGAGVSVAKAQLDAAQRTLDKTQGKSTSSSHTSPHDAGGSGGEGFFSKKVVGPVKVWQALAGGVAAVGGVYLWRRK